MSRRTVPLKSLGVYPFFIFTLIAFVLGTGEARSQKSPGELTKASEFIKVVKHYRYLDPDSAILFVKAGMRKALLDRDEIGYADLLSQYGMIMDNAARYRDSRQSYLEAEAIYRKKNNEKGLASILVRLGVVEKRKANYDNSLAYFMQALELSTKNGDRTGILEARVVLSENYLSVNDFKSCLENLAIAEKIDRQLPSSNFSLNMFISYGYLYTQLKQYDKAIEYINQGLSRSNKPKYNGSKVTLLKQLGTAYFEKGDISRGIGTLKSALELAREIKNVMRQMTVLQQLANTYTESSPDTAIKYLDQALEIAVGQKVYAQQTYILKKLGMLFKKKGDFPKALSLVERSYRISEEIYYRDMDRQISSLEKAYELEKSKAQLSHLKMKANEEASFNKFILAVAVAVTLLFSITLVYYYKAMNLNRLLSQANHKLEGSNLQKDRFFSVLAHDIRSPLGSTLTILRFIANRELEEEEQEEMVGKLILHCESSLEVLDKLLSWGQMQIKGVKLMVTEFNPKNNMVASMALLRAAWEGKNISVGFDVPDNLLVRADSDHFDFLVRNLLANAIKFTSSNGHITLGVEIRREGYLDFKVADNGVGIGRDRIGKLFKLSADSTKGTSDEVGTSLGLLICKEFIDANKGSLEVESELGKGTTFTFSLPGYVIGPVAG
ncbi:MAG: hypothetical protein EOO45_17410 [Flavobacterium sp.]|nr:MAG: hypothetical protein EOO45_17410 [Flavobacterium sp.]